MMANDIIYNYTHLVNVRDCGIGMPLREGHVVHFYTATTFPEPTFPPVATSVLM